MVDGRVPTGTHGDAPDGGRLARLWPLVWFAWLPALGPPVVGLIQAHPAPARLILVLAGIALFVAVYLWAAWHNDVSRPASEMSGSWGQRWGPVVVLVALSVALILGDGPRWLELFIYTSATVGARLAPVRAVQAVVALMLLTVALGWLTGDAWSDLALAPFWVAMAGIFVILLSRLRLTNRALHAAREEIARLAVEAERLRIARDLHDLLGHNLAHMALKSEVAEALVPAAPERAAAAMREVSDVARTTLQEVRAAVAGYRQPTLAGELRGAREILAAAGIAYGQEGECVSVSPTAEAVLAWAVREGVTNVVKHSRARHCTVRVMQEEGRAGVEVLDDGRGSPASLHDVTLPRPAGADVDSTSGGSGLAGLTERAAALGGRCEAGPRPGGGFHLAVALPLDLESAACIAAADRPAAHIGAGEPA